MKTRLAIYAFSLIGLVVVFVGGDCDNTIEPPVDDTDPHWRFSEPPVDAVFYAIDGIDRHEVWLVGEKPNGNGAALYFDGISWKTRMPPTGTGGLFAVSAQGYNNIWVAGEDEQFYRYNGSQWTKWDSPASDIYDIDFGAIDFGFAVGAGGLILEFDGTDWTRIDSPVSSDLKAVQFVAADEAWAVGFSGSLLHYSSASWETVDPGTSADLYGLDFIGTDEGWICGSGGTVLKYENGSFTAQETPFPTMAYRAIGMVSDGTKGWAGGDDVRIAEFDGENWSGVELLPSGNWGIYGFDVRAADEAWAIGGYNTGGLILHYR
ncbi:MAG: hypothetical protein GY771_13440 [bacterium]|nr:hypothetical protein [bacterium]